MWTTMLTAAYFVLFAFATGAHAHSEAPLTLVSCLKGINGLAVETAQNATWKNSTTPFNIRFSYTPSAIVYPNHTSDVSNAVKCAVKSGVHVSALSGGHSYTAAGYGSQNGTLVIMFRNMAQVEYRSADATASIGPGARLGNVAVELNNKYGRAMAHGLCPYVGVGGHTAFGGWGLASRNWGLLIDQLVGAELVLANGSVINVSLTQSPELFWAIRGAAAAFGIVTKYTFKTHQAPSTVVRYSFIFNNPKLSPEPFAKLLGSYQTWGRTAPKELGIVANVLNGGKEVNIGGYYMGTLADFKRISASLLQVTGAPNTTYLQERSWLVALAEVGEGELDTIGKPDGHDTFFAKSLVVPTASPLTSTAFSTLATHFADTPLPGTTSWFIQFELWGGGDSLINSFPSNATAYPHRTHLWCIQFYVRTTRTWTEQGTAFITGMVDAITDSMPGVPLDAYANYLDPELKGWHNKYYAGNYPRLAALQKQVDPKGVFLKTQNIGAPDF